MENIIYPAIFTYEEEIIQVILPNFGDNYITYGESIEEAIENSKEVLTLELSILLDKKEDFPKQIPREILKNKLKENQDLVYINMWLPYELSKIKIMYKKKTLTIPAWIDNLATSKNINFSKVLVEGLKKELKIN